ncbi:MAG: ECF RNA polymerase sigma-E factor [Bacteroidetes bacterium ADurb.Bin139]|nr:MAG: ECF RNA polymerase sigma-E factor [Bacteroidetes bacterium ADurb.Bin139]HQN82690.1 RNA polymerase sigma factor [Bacteroidales bacterium]
MTQDVAQIQKVLDGDIRAYAALVNQYQSMVFVLVRSVCRSAEDAQEVTQDVFLKVYQQLHTYKGNASFRTWLYRIAYNTAISSIRKTQSRERRSEAYAQDVLHTTDQAEEETDDPRVAQQDKLRSLLETLPPQDRMLIELYYYKELKMDEVATICGLTQSNAKVRIFRIRQKLQDAMTAEEGMTT